MNLKLQEPVSTQDESRFAVSPPGAVFEYYRLTTALQQLKVDEFVKSPFKCLCVIPAKAGIQEDQ